MEGGGGRREGEEEIREEEWGVSSLLELYQLRVNINCPVETMSYNTTYLATSKHSILIY